VIIESQGVGGFIEFFARKGAHFTVFFFLAYFTYRAMRIQGIKISNAFVYSLLFAIIYAISDEIHQSFTEDRTPLLNDVVIDSIGAFFGIVIRAIKK
jgi:VanZ family protein